MFLYSLLLPLLANASEPEAIPEPDYYICTVQEEGPFGTIWYSLDVPTDGSAPSHRMNWQIPRRAEGLKLWVQSDSAPRDGRFDEQATVFLYFNVRRRVAGRARLELRRRSGFHSVGIFAFAGPFQRVYRWPGGGLYYIRAEAKWGDVEAWIGTRERLTVAMVDTRSNVIAEDLLEASTLAASEEAIAVAQAEMDEMVADYRNRCAVPQPIVI